MPQQRRASPRRRDRRSRSRSRSPRRRRRSHSRSRSRDRRRSRSPQRKRSPERKLRSPPRKRSPPKKRSPSPKRHAKSRSRSPKRRARYSSSPSERGYPVKRPADSSVKRQGYRSRSASPTAQKRLRDDKPFREESRDMHRSRRTPSPSAGYGGKMYSDQPSSSKEPLFPAGSSRRKPEIDFVTIVEKGPKREKLNKRFETLEQVAQGSFDFEENITIGIHRGPQHIQLHEDEDIEVNYEFNQKTFKMLFPKKDYSSAIFDREEIRAFHHDDILDEEAYVEKRTISIKPVEKPKSRKYSDEIDYKVTVGSERDGYGDRRMVHDSGSRSRPSRSSGYNDIPVTVRLDPKPDPRYEKIYKEQQRQADQSLIQEKIQRNPNDLRYNLMRRKSDGDRGDRSRDAPKKGMMDARSRIEARRESHGDGRRDRSAPERRTPPRIDDRKRRNTKTDLPDFKNRPDKLKPEPEWKLNPTVTPKGQSYYEHDNRSREDMTFWERKQMFLKTGRYPQSGPRGRGGFRGRAGRGRFGPAKKFGGEIMDVWKHDKFDEVDDDLEANNDEKETEGNIDEKDISVGSKELRSRRVSSSEKKRNEHKESSSRKKSHETIEKEKIAIRKEEETLNTEVQVEVT